MLQWLIKVQSHIPFGLKCFVFGIRIYTYWFSSFQLLKIMWWGFFPLFTSMDSEKMRSFRKLKQIIQTWLVLCISPWSKFQPKMKVKLAKQV